MSKSKGLLFLVSSLSTMIAATTTANAKHCEIGNTVSPLESIWFGKNTFAFLPW